MSSSAGMVQSWAFQTQCCSVCICCLHSEVFLQTTFLDFASGDTTGSSYGTLCCLMKNYLFLQAAESSTFKNMNLKGTSIYEQEKCRRGRTYFLLLHS